MNPMFFCPNEQCIHHHQRNNTFKWYRPIGFHQTKAFGPVQRYICMKCRKSFSDQTFHLNYYAKKVVDYYTLGQYVIAAMNDRAISRNLNISPDSVVNRIHRLSRQCIASNITLRENHTLNENLVADGFESFDVSQFFPNNIHLLVGKKSQFVYFFNHLSIRRKGKMTSKQKAYGEKLYETINFQPQTIVESFSEVADQVEDMFSSTTVSPLRLYTDEKPQYVTSIKNNKLLKKEGKAGNFMHVQINSKLARTTVNDLFSVNYMDREIRKDIANHRRETTCFSRNVNNACARLMVYFYMHNYTKKYRIAKKEYLNTVHAEIAAIDKVEIEKEQTDLYSRRRIRNHYKPKGFMEKVWLQGLMTPCSKQKAIPAHASA
jgi:transposase-like protein